MTWTRPGGLALPVNTAVCHVSELVAPRAGDCAVHCEGGDGEVLGGGVSHQTPPSLSVPRWAWAVGVQRCAVPGCMAPGARGGHHVAEDLSHGV